MKDKKYVIEEEASSFDPNRDKAWYVINSFSGYEFKVESDLRAIMKNQFPDLFDEVLIIKEEEIIETLTPTGKVKKRVKVTNKFPGYVYARLVMTDEIWFTIRNTKYVSGIIGSHGGGSKPTPISDEDMNQLLLKNDISELVVRTNVDFNVGDNCIIESGPFAGQVGVINSFEKTKNIAKLTIEKFDNATIVIEVNNLRKVGTLNGVTLG